MAGKLVNAQAVRDFLKKAGGFFNVINKANIVKCEKGNLVAELTLDKDHVNQFGTMHGGLSATLIDTFTCCAILSHEKGGGDFGTSVEIHIRYYKAANLGDQLIIDAKTDRVGKYLAYMKCDITDKNTGDLISKGTQTLFMIRGKPKTLIL